MKKYLSFQLQLLLVLWLYTFSFAQAQGLMNNWYFGYNAGITFSTGSPTVITGAVHTSEGSAVFSDINGNLLFSTDGVSVYNSNNQQMPNGFGLFGDESSTQSALIVPKPGNSNQYYIFTVGATVGYWGGYDGVAYSMVDMSLSSGLGSVTSKNIPLLSSTAEKLTAVKHCNGTDYWVICHKWNSDAFYCYQVTATGINPPIISHIGSIYQTTNGDNSESTGYLKASPNGKKLAAAINWVQNNDIELFDFNNATGIISNFVPIPTSGMAYGLCFSPDNSKLYVGFFPLFVPTANIIQYNLSASPISSFVVSSIPNSLAMEYGALQLGPDGKIYISVQGSSYLAAINYPNLTGAACTYIQSAINLAPNICLLGLPNFPNNDTLSTNQVLDLGPDTSLCGNTLVLDAGSDWASYLWSTGDTSQTISVNQTGVYFVRVSTNCGDIYDDTVSVTALVAPFDIGNDTILCAGASIILDAGGGGVSYLWMNGDTSQTIVTTTSGTYWVNKSLFCGIVKDTIEIQSSPPITINLIDHDNPCSGGSDTLEVVASGGTGALSYSLNGGLFQGSPIFLVTTGTYIVTVKDTFGCTFLSNAIDIQTNDNFNLNTLVGTIACNGDSTNLTINVDGQTPPFLYSLNGGTYQATNTFTVGGGIANINIQDSNLCVYPYSFTINQPTALNVSVQNMGIISCIGDTTTLNISASGGTGSFQYSLNGGLFQNNNNFVVGAGNYVLTVQDINGCTNFTNPLILTNPAPIVVNLSASDILCYGETSILTATASGGLGIFQYSLNGNSYQNSNNFGVNAGNYVVTVQDANGCKSQSNTVSLINPPLLTLTATAEILCYASTTTIHLHSYGGTGNKEYSLDGGTYQSQAHFIVGEGVYNMVVKDAHNCTATASITLTPSPPIVITSLQIDSAYCHGENGQITVIASGGNEGFTYTWLTTPRQYGASLQNVAGGAYQLHVKDQKGCTKDSILFIPEILPPVAEYFSRPDNQLSSLAELYEGDEIQFFPSLIGVYSYSWDFGDGTYSTAQNPIHSFATFGDYTVTLTVFDAHKACTDTYALTYHIGSRCSHIFISNTFSPNGDGHNDVFYFVGEVAEFHATIFDRWGKIVQEFSAIKDIWNGQNCPEGVYTYVLEAICPDGSSLKRGGTIILTR